MIAGLLLLIASWLAASPAGASGAAAEPSAAHPASFGSRQARLAVALTPRQITIGDRVTAMLTLTLPAGQLDGEPRFPAWGERWGEAEIFSAAAAERVGEREGVVVYRQRVELAAFRTGEVVLPPVAVTVPLIGAAGEAGELATPEDLAFTVSSVLPAAPKDGDPSLADEPSLSRRPEAPPRPLPLGERFWWAAAVGTAACLWLGFLLWRRSPGLTAEPAEALPPLAELEAALARLSRVDSPLEGHVLVSRALRRYLGRQLGFPAPESSTTEIRRTLAARHLPAELAERVTEVLRACDLVKFARRPAASSELSRHGSLVWEIGRGLDRHLRPPRPAAEAAGRGGHR